MKANAHVRQPAILLAILLLSHARLVMGDLTFPVQPELVADEPFNGCEGISFNGEGRLFATCNRTLWEIAANKPPRQIAEMYSNLGLAAIGDKDLLVADFGPTNAFRNGRNSDGIIWRISPNGEKRIVATGMGDPNAILVLGDGTYLVSDDATADIHIVDHQGAPSLFTTSVNHPNGMAMSADGSTLYVAQIFSNIRPVVPDNAVWSVPLENGRPRSAAKVAVRAGPDAAPDGLVMDSSGRVYIAANNPGELWRFDPETEEMTLIAKGMFGLASLAFGAGEFDAQSIYATTTFAGGRGGKIWRIPVAATGGPLNR